MEDATNPVAAAVNAVREPQTTVSEPSAPTAPVASAPVADDIWAKKERALRKQQQDFQSEKQKYHEQKESERKKYESEYVNKNAIKEDTLGVLFDMGITPEKLTQLLLSGHNSQDPTVRAVRAELRAIKEELGQSKQSAADMEKKQRASAIHQLDREVKHLVANRPEFETIKSQGMEEAVTELIAATFDKDGYVMDVEEAALQIEDHLINEAMKLVSLPKIQQRMKPPTPPPAVKESAAPTQQPKPTLQQKMQVSTSSIRDNSWEAKKARAIAKLTGSNT